MSAKDQIKQIVDYFKREPQLKDKTDGMAEGLLLGAQLADDATELSKETDASFKALQREYTENGNGSQTTAEINVARDGEQVLDDRLKRDFGNVNAQLAQTANVLKNTITAKVPEDFDDLQSAVNFYSEYKEKQETQVIIIISSGYKLTRGLVVKNQNLSHISIASEDNVVFLDEFFEGSSLPGFEHTDGYIYENILFCGINATFPTISCLIDMENKFGCGLFLDENSHGKITEFCGVINAGEHGLTVRNSRANVYKTIWSGARNYGIRAQQGGTISAQYATSNDCEVGVFASRGSMIQFAAGEATGNEINIQAQRSRIIALDANCQNATGFASIWAMEGAVISARLANVNGAAERGLHAERGSIIDFTDGIADDVGEYSMMARLGSLITVTGAKYGPLHVNIPNTLTGHGIVFDENEQNHIIERTLADNAFTTKYPDGTQITTGLINIGKTTDGDGTFGHPFRTPQIVSHNFPKSFFGQPNVFVQAVRNDTGLARLVNGSYSWISSSQIGGLQAWGFAQSSVDVLLYYLAVGRWK